MYFFGVALLICGGFCSGCSRSENSTISQAAASTTSYITLQLNWYPEAEHGGVYQALADGTYANAALKVDVQPGGRATPIAPELTMGRAQFAIANADDVVVYRGQGMDIVAVLAPLQNNPRCILVQQASGVESFADLAGMTLQRQPGRPFLLFMEAKGILAGVQQVPYHGSVSSLVTDPKIAIQAYSFAEPLLAEQHGVPVRRLMVSDLGWNPYASVLVTTGGLIRTDPELVRRVVQTTRQGWQNYLTDPTAANLAISQANDHGMTSHALTFGSQELKPLAMPDNLPLESVGMMTLQRWQELIEQFRQFDPQAVENVAAEDCFTTQFLE
jgi:NitT/TauT family transport system substrate-binding protein